MLIKHHEKQLSFNVLNLLADYARTMQHKQILHWESNAEVYAIDCRKNTPTSTANKYLICFRIK